jgi:hypothetical protein
MEGSDGVLRWGARILISGVVSGRCVGALMVLDRVDSGVEM